MSIVDFELTRWIEEHMAIIALVVSLLALVISIATLLSVV
jgi:hypothetical protein